MQLEIAKKEAAEKKKRVEEDGVVQETDQLLYYTDILSLFDEHSKWFENKEIEKILNLRVGKPFNIVDLGNKFSELEFEYHKIGKLYFNLEQEYISKENIFFHSVHDACKNATWSDLFLRIIKPLSSTSIFQKYVWAYPWILLKSPRNNCRLWYPGN